MVGLVPRDFAHVRKLAHMMRGRAEFEELVGDGFVGLVHASLRYEEGHSATFYTFSAHCIVGAMRDGIRERSHCRSRYPVPHPNAFCELSSVLASHLRAPAPSALEALTAGEQIRALHAAIEQLPSRERQVITALYFDGLKGSQVALLLACHESRIAQLKTAGLKRLSRSRYLTK